MYLKKIRFNNFRNLQDREINFSSGVNRLIGFNGQGKTNLLEAIFMLSGAKSFRGATPAEMINHNQSESFLSAEIQNELTSNTLEISFGRKEKKYFKDHNPTALIDFYGHLICVSFTPADLSLIQGAPQGRRQFMDRHIVDLNKADLAVFMKYNKALKSKNSLLKSEAPRKEIEAWNEIIIEEGLRITKLRSDFIVKLTERANQVYAQYAANDGILKLKLKSDFWNNDEIIGPARASENFSINLTKEIAIKKSLIGSQRDDLEIFFNDYQAAAFASQGQSKSIALSLKLALVEMIEELRGESPVLILDDLESELDEERNFKIAGMLFNKERQTFISGTAFHKGLGKALRMSMFSRYQRVR